jgi:nucleoside-diphosphate-sugar epimerase
VARALIVGCGCRGRSLGARLAADGWAVRGTTRDPSAEAVIEAAGIEAVVADPERPATILELVGDVAVVHWLLGSARGEPELIEAIHGPRLERLLEKLVDTPVRGFAYEAAGAVEGRCLERGAELVREAGERWRIPVAVVAADPAEPQGWLAAMLEATESLLR